MLRAREQKSVALQSWRRVLVQPCITLTNRIKNTYKVRI